MLAAPALTAPCAAFRAAGLPLYAVGGCVRAALMGLPAADYDLCGPATVDEVLALISGQEDVWPAQVYGRMGTLRLETEQGHAEYTSFRTESYTKGHTPDRVTFTRDLHEDAVRRDFTCNAIYLHLHTGEIIDPTGGEQDVRDRLVRATSRDPRVVLADDGLRVLRMVRFAAQLRFEIDPPTLAAADAALLHDMSPERLMDELALILLSDVRYALGGGRDALALALKRLRALGALDTLLPACRCDAAACVAAPPRLALRLAALLAQTPPQAARAALVRLRLSNKLAAQVVALLEDLQKESVDDFALLRRGYAYARDLAALRPALAARVEALAAQGAPDSPKALALNGRVIADALGGASPLVGRAVDALWRHAIAHPQDNHPDALLAVLLSWKENA